MSSGRSAVLLALILAAGTIYAQRQPNSAALKNYRSPEAPALVRPYNETERLWQDFMLVRGANKGEAASQHELGLRYLFGEGFAPDTAKAAHWIAQAAMQRLPTACFNYGILLNNGWGTEWNPFSAYAFFQFAASRRVPEAQYALGLFLLDNLAVGRDESEARCWIRAASDSGYAPAVELFVRLEKRAPRSGAAGDDSRGSSPAAARNSGLGLVFLDFSQDTSIHVSDEMLLDDLAASTSDSAHRGLPHESLGRLNEEDLSSVKTRADAGSPEALALLGRWHDSRSPRDPVQATLAYARAVRLDSPRAPELLWNLTRSKGYFETLQSAVDRGNHDAAVAWASLVALGFDRQLTDEQAFGFLRKAAEAGHVQSMVELGLCYVTGRWAKQDREQGLGWWKRARARGSAEAATRLISTALLSGVEPVPAAEELAELGEAARLGSVQAELALAYARETGRGAGKDIAAAVKAYRLIAQRGNRVAYESLRRMYDAKRPPGEEFIVVP